jgi:hypothetical protein
VTTPGGTILAPNANGTVSDKGQTWVYLRIELPQGAERDGTWSVRVLRPDVVGELAHVADVPAMPALRYFLNVVPRGGPQLRPAAPARVYYTGDSINPLVGLGYRDTGFPEKGSVHLRVTRPDTGVGNLLAEHGLGAPAVLDADSLPARQSTLSALEAASGGPLVSYTEVDYELSNQPADNGGRFEGSGFFGRELRDLLTTEGHYTFQFRATYGEECAGRRELVWATSVDVGIDPDSTTATLSVDDPGPDGRSRGSLTVTPSDRYGNKLGPGRGGDIDVTGSAGTTVTGPPDDHGDGSYGVPVSWDPSAPGAPSVVIGQPGRPPVVVSGGGGADPCGRCFGWCCDANRRRRWRICALGLVAFLLLCCKSRRHRHDRRPHRARRRC